jgi:glycosyltransferase involved in cell wall biosynthesis
MMRRIAYCSPVTPIESGISDYSEELLPYLGQYAEISLFVERGVTPANPQLRRHLAVHTLDELPALHRKRPFDAIIYHLGNSPAHGAIYELAQRLPGIVVLHEWVLHHLKLWHAAERRKDIGVYLREMQQRYGAAGERVARQMSRGQLQDAAFRFPLVEDLIERADGLIGHSRYVVKQALALRPDLPAAIVPMGVPLPPLLPPAEARAQLGLPLDAPIWASFGHINPYKRMEAALRAFARFHAEQPTARYILVGSVSPSYDLSGLIRRLGLADAVTVTGYAPRAAFERYVAAADVCLNLRYPTAGETSASLLRLLGAGRPTLVSAVGSFAELPPDVCAQVDVDRSEAELILAYARLFQRQPAIAAQLGRNARAFVAREHALAGAAAGYLRFLSERYGWEPPTPQRPTLWNVADAADPPVVAAEPTVSAPAEVLAATITEIGAAAAEIGVLDSDARPLEDIAATLADLLDLPSARPGSSARSDA